MRRRSFLHLGTTAGLYALTARAARAQQPPAAGARGAVPEFELAEATIGSLQDGMTTGRLTARGIAEQYLARIDAVDKHGPAINSVIEVNPDALAISADLDRERKEKGPRGPLHGIPVLIKDN